MFTGIIEEIGTIESILLKGESGSLKIKAKSILGDVKIGDSIAVNGVCLTATSVSPKGFTADVMAETIRRSSLGNLKTGSHVNLERAMAANGRFGGHIVSGHIDGTGVVNDISKDGNAVWYSISADKNILKYIVEKGSIAIDGISLTVAYVDDEVFKVSIIPHTSSNTILSEKKKGDIVNLENDIVGKYVDKLLKYGSIDSGSEQTLDNGKAGLTMDTLIENGFM